jgi:hypothetical protein
MCRGNGVSPQSMSDLICLDLMEFKKSRFGTMLFIVFVSHLRDIVVTLSCDVTEEELPSNNVTSYMKNMACV